MAEADETVASLIRGSWRNYEIRQDSPLPPQWVLDQALAEFRANTIKLQNARIIGQSNTRTTTEDQPNPELHFEKADVLGQLAVTLAEIERLRGEAQQLVNVARDEHGVSWREIGEATGVSQQAAQTRWSEQGRERNRRNQRQRRGENG